MVLSLAKIKKYFGRAGKARTGRLLVAIAQNPRTLGVEIDENTAVVIDSGENFYVAAATLRASSADDSNASARNFRNAAGSRSR